MSFVRSGQGAKSWLKRSSLSQAESRDGEDVRGRVSVLTGL